MIAIPLTPMQTTTAALAKRSPILPPKIANINSPKASSSGISPMDGQFDRAEGDLGSDPCVLQRPDCQRAHHSPAGRSMTAEAEIWALASAFERLSPADGQVGSAWCYSHRTAAVGRSAAMASERTSPASVGVDAAVMEFQSQPPVKMHPQSPIIRCTRWMFHEPTAVTNAAQSYS
jgi:hypothetical protein